MQLGFGSPRAGIRFTEEKRCKRGQFDWRESYIDWPHSHLKAIADEAIGIGRQLDARRQGGSHAFSSELQHVQS